MKPGYLRSVLFAASVAVLCAALVANAARVQGAELSLALCGAVVGGVLGAALAVGRASWHTATMVFGSLGMLQFFRLAPCDGSVLVCPLFGAGAGLAFGWLLELAYRFGRQIPISSKETALRLRTRPAMRFRPN
jgi:hypothetical protein